MALGGGLFSAKELVATSRMTIGPEKSGTVETWTLSEQRQEASYHTILTFLMYYARMMFFLSFRDSAQELYDMIGESVDVLAAAGDGPAPDVAHGWRLVSDMPGEGTHVYEANLFRIGKSDYKSKAIKPDDPDDTDVQGSVLLYLQHLVDKLPVVERAYLALSLKGMAEYYDKGHHWHTTKSLHPAPAYGMEYARRVLERPGR